jgi:glutathione S-transferase
VVDSAVPENSTPDVIAETEAKMSVNVQNDLDWLEAEIGKSSGDFPVGNRVTAVDTMMAFSVQFIMARALGTQDKRWPKIEAWLQCCEGTESYQRAVERSGHTLYPEII